ncbi:hypothetical protein CCP3SC15_710001 [Gammaproteobacteria bacterium]
MNWLKRLFNVTEIPAREEAKKLASLPWDANKANCAQKCAAYARFVEPLFGDDVRIMLVQTIPGYEYISPKLGTIRQHAVIVIRIKNQDWFLDIRNPLYFEKRPPHWVLRSLEMIPRTWWMDQTNGVWADPKGYVKG